MKNTKKQPAGKKPNKQAAQYSFFENVWDVVRQIPKGRVTSYGAIAAYLGTPKAARTVGYAMNACHGLKPKVPAHRVVNRNGLLSGRHHFGSPHAMQHLLEKEKIAVANNQVIDFKSLFWDPCVELGA